MIKVGGATETEMKEKKARVEGALHATRAAVEEVSPPAPRWRCLDETMSRNGRGRGQSGEVDSFQTRLRVLVCAGRDGNLRAFRLNCVDSRGDGDWGGRERASGQKRRQLRQERQRRQG